MNKYLLIILVNLFFINSCNNVQKLNISTPVVVTIDKCIPPITTFAFPVNIGPSRSSYKQILPPSTWQAETLLPEVLSTGYVYDYVLFARSLDKHNEVWLEREINSENDNEVFSITKEQFFFYRTDLKEWNKLSEEIDYQSLKSRPYLAKDGVVWASVGSSASDTEYFAKYNDQVGRFEIPASSTKILGGQKFFGYDGKLWIVGGDGIYSFDPVHNIIKQHINISNLETRSTLFSSMSALAPDGSIYFMNVSDEIHPELLHFSPMTGQLDNIVNSDIYLGGISYNLFVDHLNRLWLGDLGWMEPSGTWYRIIRSPIFITDRSEAGFEYIWGNPSIVLESSNGLLWFYSENGMAWLDPQKEDWCWFTTEKSNIVEDQNHNLWMIAGGKLYKYTLER